MSQRSLLMSITFLLQQTFQVVYRGTEILLPCPATNFFLFRFTYQRSEVSPATTPIDGVVAQHARACATVPGWLRVQTRP